MAQLSLGSNNITSFVLNGREDSLLIGDYSLYANRLAHRLLACRKRLGLATPKGAKYAKDQPITIDHIKQSHDYISLLLLHAERCWAKAMHIKSLQPEDAVVTGLSRSHVITKFHQAAKHAWNLYLLLKDRSASGAAETDILQARAYHASLVGAEEFEKQSQGRKSKKASSKKDRWDRCLRSYATTRVIYIALSSKLPTETYQDFIANTIDPTLRYVAHQARLSRTIAIPTIALRYFPRDDAGLSRLVDSIDPQAMNEQPQTAIQESKDTPLQSSAAPSQITWRGIKADIVDAAIGQALAQVVTAEKDLSQHLASRSYSKPDKKAALYDNVLLASQEAVDATRRATEELEQEGTDEGDSRMQDLRVTNLYVQYSLISWRVGRNRVLIGCDDGMVIEQPTQRAAVKRGTITLARSTTLAYLRKRLVLYDAIIQSIELIKSIRGAMRDNAFVADLQAKLAYFQALKCFNIAQSHSLYSSNTNALALLSKARDLADQCSSLPPATTQIAITTIPTLDISAQSIETLHMHIERAIERAHALVEMELIHEQNIVQSKASYDDRPLLQRIREYPEPGLQIDLSHATTYPPTHEMVPVKPIFLDVAWNYIDYPGRASQVTQATNKTETRAEDSSSDVTPVEKTNKKEKKGGWFSFGGS